jgi:O-antigen/teichoic acid export membrane protein
LITSAVLGFVLVVVVARGLGARGAGVFLELVAFFSILAALAEMGAGPGLVRTISRARAMGKTEEIHAVVPVAAWPVLALSAAAAVGTLIVAPSIVRLLDLPADAIGSLRILAPFIPLSVLTSVALATTRGFGRVVPYVGVELLAKPVLRPLLVLGVMGLGLGPLAVVLAWAAPTALALPIAAIVALSLLRHNRPSPADRPREPARALAGRFWAFAAPRGIALFLGIVLVWLDVILVGILATHREAGIYGTVGRLAYVGVIALEAMRLVIAPQFSHHLARGDKEGAEGLYRVGTWWVMAVSWPFYLLLAVFAPTVMRIFGAEFVQGQHALVILSMAMLVGMAAGNVSVVLLMAGKSVWNMANASLAVATNVILNLLLIPRIGIAGAAVAWMGGILVNNLVPLVQIRRHLGMTPLGTGFFLTAAAALACYGGIGLAVRAIAGEGLTQILIAGVVSTTVYAWILFRLRSTLHLPLLTGAMSAWMTRMRRGRPVQAGAGVER